MALFSPIMLSTQAWEAMHTVTGLPWWLTIPVTTIALRTALLPLDLKAKAASVNFALMEHAYSSTSRLALQLQGGGASSAPPAAAASDAPAPDAQGPDDRVERLRLALRYYRYLRRRHRTPAMAWFGANIFVQARQRRTPRAAAAAATREGGREGGRP